jgi:hypothetical protein
MSGTVPSRLESETRISKTPLQVDPTAPDQKLHARSRINFAKIYVVEHGVKVLPIGKMSPSSMPLFIGYFRDMDYDSSDEDINSAPENEGK